MMALWVDGLMALWVNGLVALWADGRMVGLRDSCSDWTGGRVAAARYFNPITLE